ncbi:hypothetical protein Cva_00030 [Caedimonas varicaedens]|jgi:hypothetical protein|uniref:Uncharacterized protein n=1 Tax=Caedimonas varicaedens TaxID=1629334 RepID=A0A0K8MBX0_9PROT|nr:hypothetical protein Cva_00030 [Caedimonas varicaedens]
MRKKVFYVFILLFITFAVKASDKQTEEFGDFITKTPFLVQDIAINEGKKRFSNDEIIAFIRDENNPLKFRIKAARYGMNKEIPEAEELYTEEVYNPLKELMEDNQDFKLPNAFEICLKLSRYDVEEFINGCNYGYILYRIKHHQSKKEYDAVKKWKKIRCSMQEKTNLSF